MDAYAAAQSAWQEKIAGRMLSAETEPGKSIWGEFKLETTDPEEAMQAFWQLADLYTLASSDAISALDGPP